MLQILIVLSLLLTFYLIMIMPNFLRRKEMKPFLQRDYAHRGLHSADKLIPENSMAAFREALNNNLAIEQMYLSGKFLFFCFLTGRCEQLFLQILNRFIEICDCLVQLCGLFLMAFGHLLDRKALAVHQLTKGFNCLFLKLHERFHF